jgi:polyribonucleotide nucleotidyltransferase
MELSGRLFSMETGRLAKQAHGAVVVRFADSMVLSTVVSAPTREKMDFFPLTVDYRERMQAAGKIPGGRFYKREGRPSTKEVLTMRMTDRPMRPAFPKSFRDELLIMGQVLSADGQNDPDILSINGASASLMLSPVPFRGPVGAVRVGRIGDQFIINPTVEQVEHGDLDLVVASNRRGVVMLEGGAKELPDEVVVEAILFGHQAAQKMIDVQEELVRKAGVAPKEFDMAAEKDPLEVEILARYGAKIRESACAQAKSERRSAVDELRDQIVEKYVESIKDKSEAAQTANAVKTAFWNAKRQVIRRMILDEKRRCDGRTFKDIRPIECQVGFLPMTHGSALFQRGETQAVVTATLGTLRDEEIVDGLNEEYKRKFLFHYYFPSFSTGEVSMPRGPGRREIGHGALAERSLEAVIPPADKFPYTVRLVADILESNGSSSMASVCGGTLALMDAGVQITQPVAGISIGLVSEGDQYETLTDIMGEEDFNGDMDFKIAGSQKGVTGIQLDLKIDGITEALIRRAVDEAREARIQILRTMLQTLPRPRRDLSPNAPRIETVQINREKIGAVIGPGGKMVRQIEEQTGAKLDISDDGTIFISGSSAEGVRRAREFVERLTEEAEVGKIYSGRVVSIKDFGCFVEILPGQEGMVHISELADSYVDKVDDVVQIGDMIKVRVIGIDDQGRIRLSRRAALSE